MITPADILRWIVVAYLLVTLFAVVLALWLPKEGKAKKTAVVIVLAVFGFWPITDLIRGGVERYQFKARQQKSAAMFRKHCETAGEKIHRTVDNVEGVYLLKIRPAGTNFSNQFALDDPYGHEGGGDLYIRAFLREQIKPKQPNPAGAPPRNGYRYVDVDEGWGRYRYTGRWKDVLVTSSVLMGGDGKHQFYSNQFVLDKMLTTEPAPRYGVTYDDLSTEEDRKYWIAGSSLRVIDLQTQEVIAERIGYMWDPAQGATGGGRSPWLMAANYACPGFQRNPNLPIPPGQGASAQLGQAEDFVEKILIPKLD